jgi:hypothetical protein
MSVSIKNLNFFDDFKPIRNHLRKLNFFGVLKELDILIKNQSYVPEVLEFVFINSVIYCPDYGCSNLNTKSKEWHKVLKLSDELNEKINSYWIDNQGAFNYLHKFLLNQLKAGAEDTFHIYRYYYIFSDETISKHIESVIGMPYRDFFTCSLWIYSLFKQNSYAVNKNYFFQSEYNDTMISEENMKKTLSILSISLSDLRSILENEVVYDMNTFITHDYSRYSIIENNDIIFCLFRNQLLYQFTSGMYYLSEIYHYEKELSQPFGNRFAAYVRLVADKCNPLNKIQIKNEIIYKKNRSEAKTSDIVIETPQDIVFIECKTKRLQIKSKKYCDILAGDIKEIVKAVVEVYKVYLDYSNNLIPDLAFTQNKYFVPLVVTLEEWYAVVPNVADDIETRVKSSLKKYGIDDSIIDKYMYHIISIENFEREAQIMFEFGFSNYYDKSKKGSLKKEEFKYRNLFENFISDSLIKPLKKQFTEMKIEK